MNGATLASMMVSPELSIDTAAWLDITVHHRATPRTLAELREDLHAHLKYSKDADTLKYRDERKRKQDGAGSQRRGARW